MPSAIFGRLRTIHKSLRSLVNHPSLQTTLLIGGGGIAMMLANVIYAKILDPESFGRLVLMQAIAFVVMGLLPFGFENLIARREIDRPVAIIAKVLAIGSTMLALILGAGYLVVPEYRDVLLFVFLAGVTGAAIRLFAAIEQSELLFLRSQVISQGPAILFLGCAIFQSFYGISEWQSSAISYVASYAAGTVIGYVFVRGAAQSVDSDQRLSQLWVRALALIGILASLLLLNQMALFVAAGVLSLPEVGALGLATTMIASPFRLLSHGVGYTLLPRMAACDSVAERKKLLLNELLIGMAVGIPGAALLFFLVPLLVDALFADQYDITLTLVVALIALGLVRLIAAVISAAINALGDTKSLHVFNLTGWISAAIAAGAAFALSGYGSPGIVAGVACGWAIRIVFASALIRGELREKPGPRP